jgi:DNA-binding NarL/FixJ family response regulator
MPQVPDVPGVFLFYTASNRKPGTGRFAEGEMMRVLLADDNPKVRFALTTLLQRRSELVVVGEANDAAKLLVRVAEDEPDLLLMDWQLPGLTEVGSIPALRKKFPDLMIVVLSGRPELAHEALSLGADDFVSKIDPPENLLGAIAACVTRLEEKRLVVTVQ